MGAQHILEAERVLRDLTFFETALRAPDPKAALLQFADKKREDPLFSTREACREIGEAGAPDLEALIPAALSTPEARQAWHSYKSAVAALKYHVPTVRQVINSHMEELQWELTRPAESISLRLLALIRDGYDTVDTLASMANRDRAHCQAMLRHLVEQGKITSAAMERVPGARGAAKMQYFLAGKNTKSGTDSKD